MKKAGIYDPYLDTLGGGERYSLTVANCLAERGFEVDIFWDQPEIAVEIKRRFGIDPRKFRFVPNVFPRAKVIKKWLVTKKYDLFFYLSDGSIPFLFAQKNILHFQVPFHGLKHNRVLEGIKFRTVDKVVCNSNFTKKFIDKEFVCKSKVVYPPVSVEQFYPGKKEKIIFSVGRFSTLMQFKRQDILIKTFCQMGKQLPDWRLILAGGVGIGGSQFLNKIKKMAKGEPIEIIENPSYVKLKKLYSKASIFWLASGWGIDENKNPERVEHFGITVIEAMAAGAIPVIINKGGPPEIVKDGKDGLLWETEEELIEKTSRIIKDLKLRLKLSHAAEVRARDFSETRFCHEIKKITE